MKSKTRRLALTGMLFALAMVLGVLESAVVPLMGLPPGIKPGLANIVVLYALLFLPGWESLMLVLLKAGLGFITRGAVAGGLSLAGGLLSLLVMWCLLRLPRAPGIALVSVAGALAHNLGQLSLFAVLFGAFAFSYAPVLAVSGVVMGLLTALTLRALLPVLRKASPSPAPKVSPGPPPGPPPGPGHTPNGRANLEEIGENDKNEGNGLQL